MLDAHCHLDLYAPERAPAEALAAGRAAGVEGWVIAGVDPAGWRAQAALAAAEPDLWCCYGIHPWTAAAADDEQIPGLLRALSEALDGDPRPVGLGELGLDHGRRGPPATRARQLLVAREQLALARERDLPVVLHVVGAYGTVLELLRRDGLPRRGGMIHRYSGAAEMVPDLVRLGLYLSFSPTILHVARAQGALRATPDERLLLETDAPDRLPEAQGGDEVDLAFLGRVLRTAAAQRDQEASWLSARCDANLHALFELQ